MAHELDITNGVASFANSRADAWHRLGTSVGHAMTGHEAMQAAHLANWNVRKMALVIPQEPVITGLIRWHGEAAPPGRPGRCRGAPTSSGCRTGSRAGGFPTGVGLVVAGVSAQTGAAGGVVAGRQVGNAVATRCSGVSSQVSGVIRE